MKFTRGTLNWAAGTTLTLRLRDPRRKAVAFIYRMGQAIPTLMQRFNDEYRIRNAESVVDGRTSLYLPVANPHYEHPYTDTTPVELEVQLQAAVPQWCIVEARTYNSTRSETTATTPAGWKRVSS